MVELPEAVNLDFRVIGNPSDSLSKGMNCMLKLQDNLRSRRTFGFQLNLYGIITVLGILLFIIIF